MKRAAVGFAAFAILAGSGAQAQEIVEGPAPWEFTVTAYGNSVRNGESYMSGVFMADKGALHLEGRANYEAIHAQSLFAGWNFSWGDEEGWKLDVTPIAGAVRGPLRGAIAGFEATVTRGRFDFYTEAEHVFDRRVEQDSYSYAWSELGYRVSENLRIGLVGQRTRIYGGSREYQRGGLVQAGLGPATFAVYWFNPGSSDQVVIGSIGLAF
jgi:hypothetical protein